MVRVEAVGICGSDLEMVSGSRDPAYCRYPVVLGHEWAGVVERVGPGAVGVSVGDRVAVEGHNYCGICGACKRGQTQLCETYEEFGFTVDGGYAELVTTRADLCHVICQASSREAAFAEPTSCALHGVRRSGLQAGNTALVVGAGTIGLLAAAIASLHSPEKLIVAHRRDDMRELAHRLGATHFVSQEDGPLPEQVAEITGGRGVDVSLEAAGSAEAVSDAVAATSRGGCCMLLGISGSGGGSVVDADTLVFGDVRLEGVFAYPSDMFGKAVGLIDSSRLEVEPLVSHTMPLSRVEQAFDVIRDPRQQTVKVLLDPQET